ncbi:Glycosidase [Nonomuraea solani]|uniref:Glycosidase n=1 Tax=Nonomuraea solani TaxID=1144553 RepID=A0A1H6EWG0_9ACTN|nr:alpha-amylase family glycosyl hydrolase [Nonomuraea solani]SEH01255.1 Glycosidase [Nonomuraea solani]
MALSWSDQAIWWQVYPLGFTGAPPVGDGGPVRHGLRHLRSWLDHVAELGCTGLQLGPIFASETHGYDTVDHFAIDRRLGDDADFDALVGEAGERGLRIVLDGVFNHVGRSFAGDPGWLRRGPDGEPDTFEGHDRLVALDHGQEAVRAYVASVLGHWLDRGAAGWRLDAAYAVPAEFWSEVLPRVRARHPQAWFAGEVIHGDYAGYVARSGLDSVTQYELWKAIWSSLNDRNLYELAHALDRHDAMLESFTPLTFTGNHDVTRLATRLDDPRHLGHALAVLFTVGGAPSVYYGDELGLQGVKEEREGGDDAIRPAFPATPADLPKQGREVFGLHRRLIALRRANPWLARARTSVPHLANRSAVLRSGDGSGQALLTLLNLDDRPYRFPLGPGRYAVAEAGDAGAGDPALVPAHGWRVLLPAP